MSQLTFSITQSLQLAAFIPCLIIVFFLIFSTKQLRLVIIPILYFLALSAGFLLQLLNALTIDEHNIFITGPLFFLANMITELSFLLILQFITGLFPKPVYFLVFAIPLFIGGPFTYLYLEYQNICFRDGCISAEKLLNIYRVLTGSLTFLILTFIMTRAGLEKYSRSHKDIKRHKYWLVISLIMLNLIILSLNLVNFYMENLKEDLQFIEVMIKVAFVYMVLSSIYRVAGDVFGIKPLTIFSNREEQVARRIDEMLKKEFTYRKPGFSRKMLANMLGVNETQLSKIINVHFKKSFRELINDYRIEEAKALLKKTHKNVSSISYQIGFTSITSFNRVFRDKVGMSASSFRRGDNKMIKQTVT